MKNRIIALPLTILTIIICVPATLAFTDILKNLTINSRIELGFFIGFAVYLVIHIVFYKPVFIHVMAHELTHIFWAFLFGGKAKKLEVSASGGRVLINRTNFVITLAPYFFPLYTFIFLAVYIIAKEQYLPYIAFLIGASLSFHIALTLYSMKSAQSDFHEDSNIFFSLSFVYLMNIIVIALIFSILSEKVAFLDFLKDIPGKFVYIYHKASAFMKAFAG
ncbi:MAG TPA: M50 family metallopeptidase [Candidatus Goldiibacteriota bacterium]|nr:M50 family metallopeptidase [Candidatus Goldiibacteriota bacterium]HPN64645.1 M50 family metallopeptidase [Candidatus Goldiibacteriota bacterium]HRQ44730.1 M50 family metallopeptidase [Candidatus Goldiibacteriota bacterium]